MSAEEAQERTRIERLAQLGNTLAAFAHEVRNPLSTIGLNLQLVKEDFNTAETPRDKRTFKRLTIVEEEVRRLQSILEEFLRFARSPQLRVEAQDLNTVVQALVDFMAPEMRERGVALRFYPDTGALQVPIDRDQIRAAVLNLLRNALEACRPGDEVLVSTRAEDGCALLRVTDTGPGMTPDVRERVFTPYFSTKRTGTGLGLATVRRIVEEHGGRIDLTSEVGKGTQFTVRLPVAVAAGTAAASES